MYIKRSFCLADSYPLYGRLIVKKWTHDASRYGSQVYASQLFSKLLSISRDANDRFLPKLPHELIERVVNYLDTVVELEKSIFSL